MRLMLYPGSFDPPHVGHMRLLESAVTQVSPDLTLIMPVCGNQEDGGLKIPMLEQSVRECLPQILQEWVDVAALDPRHEGNGLTNHVIFEFQERHKATHIQILLGAKGADEALKWSGFLKTKEISLVLGRGVRSSTISKFTKSGFSITPLAGKPSPVQSKNVRSSISKGKLSKRHVSPSVAQMIVQHGLYGCKL